MNSTQKVVMAVVTMVAVATLVVTVYFAFFHKTKSCGACPHCVSVQLPTQTGALKVLGSGKFLRADGTLTSNASEATAFTVFKCTGVVYPTIETINWTMTTVDNVSVLSAVDKQLGSIIMDVSKSPVGAKPQSVMAGLHDNDCQLVLDPTPHSTGLLPNPTN